MRAAGRVLAALVVASASVLLPAAAAAAGEDCVGVVVDSRLLGGGVRTACATGDPKSGLQALTRAGFSYAFVPRQPGLVCQVDRTPECSRTSTTTYWSYWYRAAGASAWTYSSVGAGSRDPEPGSTEAWVWQDGGRREPPDVAFATLCPQTRTNSPAKRSGGGSASAPDRPTTSTRTPGPSTSRAAATRRTSKQAGSPVRERDVDGASSTSARTLGRGASGRAAPAPPASGPAPAAEPTSGAPSTPSAASDPPSTAAAAVSRPTPADDDGSPGPLGLAVGLALVLSLATAAVLRARRPGGSP